jgi:hypothetical protein
VVFAEAELKPERRLTELKLDTYALTGENKVAACASEFEPGRWQPRTTDLASVLEQDSVERGDQ